MVDENRPEAGWGSRFVRNFHRSWSWLAAVGGFVLAVGPDLANLILSNTVAIAAVFPEMSLRQKAAVLLTANVLTILLRPVKQKNMPPETIAVLSVTVPDTVAMEPSGISLATEIERVDRVKAAPGPGG